MLAMRECRRHIVGDVCVGRGCVAFEEAAVLAMRIVHYKEIAVLYKNSHGYWHVVALRSGLLKLCRSSKIKRASERGLLLFVKAYGVATEKGKP